MPCTQAVSPSQTILLQQNGPGQPQGQMMIIDFPRLFQMLHASEDEVRGLDNNGARDVFAERLAGLVKIQPCVRSCILIESIALGLIFNGILLNRER